MLQADEGTVAQRDPRFFAPDGWFDVSGFLDTAYGFVPLAVPITEPAVGYGAAGALIFIDRHAPGAGQAYSRPNIAAVGGLATENGTRGLFAGHMGNWMDGRLRTLAALADADVNLDFFGLGGDRLPGSGAAYQIAARGGLIGGSYRLGESPWWVGLRYALAKTTVTFDTPFSDLPGVNPRDLDTRLGGLTPSITYDTRDNFFSPTQGWYVDLSVPVFREALGGDVDFDKVGLTAMYYRPLQRSLYFAVRGSAATSSNGTPFYLRPFVWLRGVQMLRYQGDQAGEVEAELRWQFHPRFSVVGFAGAGLARGSPESRGNQEKSVTSAGAGVRYLIAREHGLQMGVDVGFGPNEPILYIVFGSSWMWP
jgi:surface antigen Omp85-like protein